MSAEVIELASAMNQEDIHIQIAFQCAPLLMGVKLSNLLCTTCENEEFVRSMFLDTSISIHTLYKKRGRVTFLLYQRERLIEYLMGEKERCFLEELGYEILDLDIILEKIAIQYTDYMNTRKHFPHELGLLLEYPVEDVIGFMKHQGKNSIYTGYWKVYHDLEYALKTFRQYEGAKEKVIRSLSNGMCISHFLETYHNNNSYMRHS